MERFDEKESDTAETTVWKAFCHACQSECKVNHKLVLKNTTCGCAIRSLKYSPGKKYGMLTIVSEAPRNHYKNKRQVYCKCDCGNQQLTLVTTNNLISGNTTSCGCYGEARRKTHGMSHTRTYNIHEGMLRRCKPALAVDFPYHAGKGISVCARWAPELGGSFENFLQDMGECPDGLSLDRIDVNGDYTPENCRWATLSFQGYNKGMDPNNTSGKTGVSFYNRIQKWSAEIHVDGNHIRLGLFEKFEDAVKAREKAEIDYYGWNKQ